MFDAMTLEPLTVAVGVTGRIPSATLIGDEMIVLDDDTISAHRLDGTPRWSVQLDLGELSWAFSAGDGRLLVSGTKGNAYLVVDADTPVVAWSEQDPRQLNDVVESDGHWYAVLIDPVDLDAAPATTERDPTSATRTPRNAMVYVVGLDDAGPVDYESKASAAEFSDDFQIIDGVLYEQHHDDNDTHLRAIDLPTLTTRWTLTAGGHHPGGRVQLLPGAVLATEHGIGAATHVTFFETP